jgi:hypothetical protein
MKKSLLFLLFLCLISLQNVYAESGLPLVARGAGRTLFSVLEIPKEMIVHGGQAFPLGLVGGVIGGTMKAVAGTVVGAVDMARGAAPYAKYGLLAL